MTNSLMNEDFCQVEDVYGTFFKSMYLAIFDLRSIYIHYEFSEDILMFYIERYTCQTSF